MKPRNAIIAATGEYDLITVRFHPGDVKAYTYFARKQYHLTSQDRVVVGDCNVADWVNGLSIAAVQTVRPATLAAVSTIDRDISFVVDKVHCKGVESQEFQVSVLAGAVATAKAKAPKKKITGKVLEEICKSKNTRH